MENLEKIKIQGLKTIHKLCNFGADHNMEGCTFTEIVERMFTKIEQMKTQVNTLDEMLLNQGEALAQAKAQAVPEGFVLIEKKEFEQMQEFEDLYRRAIFNSKKPIHEVNWSHVSNLGIGSTRAKAMCKRFNIDPEATFRKPQEPAND